MTFWTRLNYVDSKKIRSCPGLEEGGMNRQSAEDFWGNGTILYDTIMINTCHETVFKPVNIQYEE